MRQPRASKMAGITRALVVGIHILKRKGKNLLYGPKRWLKTGSESHIGLHLRE